MDYNFLFWFWIHTASETSTAETHTDGGAVIRKPRNAWLEGTPAISIIIIYIYIYIYLYIYIHIVVLWLLFENRHSHTQIYKQTINRTKHTYTRPDWLWIVIGSRFDFKFVLFLFFFHIFHSVFNVSRL